mgnify:CR=1 FL=1
MDMKKLFFVFLFCCVSAFVANAQNQIAYFSPGVIHLKNGEKMECFINCNSLLYSSPVDYRLSEKDKIKEMDPEKYIVLSCLLTTVMFTLLKMSVI